VQWPISVNTTVRDEIVASVTQKRGRAHLVRGPSGIGKSTLAAAVADQLAATGFTVLPVIAMPELRDVALAAMAPLLATSAADSGDTTSERLARLFSLVAPAGSKHVLVVDDGPMLDDISASTIYQLVRVYGVRCVITARTEHPFDGPLARLRDEGVLDVTELAGVSASVAGELVHAALGSVVEPASLRAVVELAAGNPLFLRELVRAATQGDAMHAGATGLIVDATALPSRLRDIIALRFDSLAPDELALAELIAVAEPLPVDLLGAPRALAALDRAGLVARTADGEVYLAHPLFAETLTALMTAGRRNDTRSDAAGRLLTSVRDDHRYRAICLRLELPEPTTADELAWAASYAHQVDDHERAIVLADAAIALGSTAPFAALVVRADALAVAGDFAAADSAFEHAASVATTDEDVATIVTRHGFYLAVRRQKPAQAVGMGMTALDAMLPSATRDYLSGNVAKWRLMLGHAPQLDLPSAADDPLSAFNTELFRLMAALFAGDLETARAAIEFVRPRAESLRNVVRHGVEMIEFAEFFALALDGHIGPALALAREKRGDLVEESVGMWSYGLALFTMHEGHLADALDLAATAVEQLTWRDFLGARGPAIAVHAAAAEQLGRSADSQGARALLDEDSRENVVTDLQLASADAWRLSLDGDHDAAVAEVRRAVIRGIEGRSFAIAALTAHVAVRIGRADAIIDELRTIAAAPSGELVASIVQHAEALVSQDPDAVLAAAERLAVAGLLAGATDAARQAAALARSQNRERLARRAALRASGWSRGLDGARATVDDLLSDREWEIAGRAANRERSKEIADALGLSARTVDNHLTNIYRKLGVSRRDELRAELTLP
jgi:DNA-binding CsgD family transcriptional regulator